MLDSVSAQQETFPNGQLTTYLTHIASQEAGHFIHGQNNKRNANVTQ